MLGGSPWIRVGNVCRGGHLWFFGVVLVVVGWIGLWMLLGLTMVVVVVGQMYFSPIYTHDYSP